MRNAFVVCCLIAAGLASPPPALPAAPAPSVVSVDPPNWWPGHSLGTIQLLVRGSSLAGAMLESSTSDVVVQSQKTNSTGTTIIASVVISPGAASGQVPLRLSGPNGGAPVSFALLERLPRANRFAGLSPDDVIYLIMPDRFSDGDTANNTPPGATGTYNRADPSAYHGGDLDGVRERLPYLKDLGITAIWLNPYYDNFDRGRDYHGYGATDFYDVEERFGTLASLRALVDAAHALGIKVVQDQVANHSGPSHPWESDYPTPTWYNGTPQNHLDNTFDIPSLVDPNASPARRRQTLEGWFGNHLPDLNQNDPDCAQYLIQNALWWVEQSGIDAIRQDTLPYVPRSFWAQWMTALKTEYPDFTVIGEVFNGDPKNTAFFQGGAVRFDGVDSRVDTVFDFPLYFQILDVFARDKNPGFIKFVLDQDSLYTNPSILVPFLGNHDTDRFLTVAGGNTKKLSLAQIFLLTTRGIPQLYYGDEIGMPGGHDPDNRRDFPGGFPGDATDAFTPAGRTKKQNKVFDTLRRALAARAANPALRGPETEFISAAGKGLVYLRRGGGQTAFVVINNADVFMKHTIPIGEAFPNGTRLVDALGSAASPSVRNGQVRVSIQPRSALIFVPSSSASVKVPPPSSTALLRRSR